MSDRFHQLLVKSGETITREVEIIGNEYRFGKWKKVKKMEDEIGVEELTMKALSEARLVFDKCIQDYGHDPAYWDIRFTAWKKDSTLSQRLSRYEIEDECKE